jgi:hypothetical protein
LGDTASENQGEEVNRKRMRLRTRGKVVVLFWAPAADARLKAVRIPSHGATLERIVCKAVNRGKFGAVSGNSGRQVLGLRRVCHLPPPPILLNFLSTGLYLLFLLTHKPHNEDLCQY